MQLMGNIGFAIECLPKDNFELNNLCSTLMFISGIPASKINQSTKAKASLLSVSDKPPSDVEECLWEYRFWEGTSIFKTNFLKNIFIYTQYLVTNTGDPLSDQFTM